MSAPDEQRSGFVTLAGWTNVGKSTLLNRLVGERVAAVAGVAQTTRHRIIAALTDPARGQIAFVDTPGLHKPRHRMNRAMVECTRDALLGVDLALLLVDAFRGFGPGDREAMDLLRRAGTPALLVLNKIDRVTPKSRLLPLLARGVEEFGFDEVIPVSALTGDGCDRLLDVIWGRLPVAPPPYDESFLTDQTDRALCAERVREKLLAELRQELPHATAVAIDGWQEREDGLVRIQAAILVDRPSQKRIVIGTGGEVLKRVGIAARQELEASLGRRVHLELWVQVREDWREDPTVLRRLGIEG